MDCSLTGSSVHGIFQNTGVGCHSLHQGNLSDPGIELRSPALEADSLLSEPPVEFYLLCFTIKFPNTQIQRTPCSHNKPSMTIYTHIRNIHICVLTCAVISNSLHPCRLYPTSLLYHGNSPGKNTGVGCHALPQGIFPTQGLNPGLLHCKQILYLLSYPEAMDMRVGS